MLSESLYIVSLHASKRPERNDHPVDIKLMYWRVRSVPMSRLYDICVGLIWMSPCSVSQAPCRLKEHAMQTDKLRIGLLWHSLNSNNLGVGALTVAHLDILAGEVAKLGCKAEYVVFCWTDPQPFYFTRPDIQVVQIRMKDIVLPHRFAAACRRCDVVLDIGAGDSFADIYGVGRIWRMLLAQNIALLTGRPFVISPQTIGPFKRAWTRRLALNVMRRARVVATRDDLSTGFAREMGYRDALIEATDVALRLPYTPAPRPPDGKIRVGLNVSGLLFSGGYTQDNMFGLKVDYPGLVCEIIRYFLGQENCELHLVGHVSKSQTKEVLAVEDDRTAHLTLAKTFPDVIVAPEFAGPSDAKSYIAGLDFFMGARMHACIAAFSSGVPVIPMAYSRKFAGLFGTLGYDHTADCRTEDADTILTRIRDGFENCDQLRADAEVAYKRGLSRLGTYETAIGAMFAKIAVSSTL